MTRNQELREEAKKRGYTHDNFKCLRDLEQEGNPNLDEWYYESSTDVLFTNSCGKGGKAVYKEGVWAEKIKPVEEYKLDLSMCRILVDNAEQSKKLQELAFELGYSWSLMGKTVSCTHGKVLYFNSEDYRITYSDLDYDNRNFETFHFTEIFKETEPLNNKNMVDLMGYSVLVDNEEQGKKLQEIAIEQGFTWLDGEKRIQFLNEASFQFGYNGKKIISYNYGKKHYQDDFITKKAHFNDLFKEETLQEKEQRLLKELEEVRKEIEDSKIKVGDWAVVKSLGMVYKRLSDVSAHKDEVKLTNPELIKLLEQEMN